MLYNFLISAWRNIISNPIFSCINILGLALGIAVCLLILLFVRKESNYENWIPNAERIVRLHTAYTLPNVPALLTVRSAGRMKQALVDYAAGELAAGTHVITHEMVIKKDAEVFTETLTLVNENFLEFFPLPLSQGDTNSALRQANNLIISEAMALKYFGRSAVVGETLTVCCIFEKSFTLPIVAVMQAPENTHLKLDFVVRMNQPLLEQLPDLLNTWTSVNLYTYFQLTEGTSPAQALERIHYWVDHESPFLDNLQHSGRQVSGEQVTDTIHFNLIPLPDLHLKAKADAGTMGDMTPMGDHRMIRHFSLIALLVMFIACANFINLSTARGGRRAKEVAMRKTLGASRLQIALQFLMEAQLIVVIGFVLALSLVELVLPAYNSAIGQQLAFNLLQQPGLVLLSLAAVLLIGLAAGAYPALILSRFTPARILSASKGAESSTSSKLRDILVVFQFAISIALLACTAVIYGQTQFTQQVDLGFNYQNKLILDISETRHLMPSLKNQLQALPEVEQVVFSSEAPSQDRENNRFFSRLDAPAIGGLLNYYHVDYNFFESYSIAPVAGRLFDPAYGSDAIDPDFPASKQNPGRANVVVNRRMLKKFGFNNPEEAIGEVLMADIAQGHFQLTIIGVIPDIHFRSLKFGVRDNVYLLNPQRFRAATISYRNAELPKLLAKIESLWRELAPQQPVKLQFLSEMIAAQYRSEYIQTKMFSAFSLLAVLLACLGLYGLISFATQRRTREIGIRKVLGAGVGDIVGLLVWQLSKPVLFANVVAWPAVWIFMTRWLSGFNYRIEWYWIIVAALLASLLCVVIAWLTVGVNAAIAASAKPVKALRYE